MRVRGIVCLMLAFAVTAPATSAQTPVPGAPPAAAKVASPSGEASKPAAVASPLLSSPAKPPAPALGPVATRAADLANTAGAEAASRQPAAPRWIPITVVGRHGGAVQSFSPSDIVVVEDGARQRVTALERWPLWLVVVLDVGRQVGPMKQLALHRQIVYDLLYALGEDDHVAIVQYADGMDVIQPWTLDVREAEQAINERFESGLEGQLWNSVAFSAEELLRGKLGHRAVVVITDGVDDTGDTMPYDRAVGLLRETATTLYVVNLSRYLAERIREEAYGVNGVLNVITSPSYIGRRKQLREYHEKIGEAPPQMLRAATESGGRLWHVAPEEEPETLPERIWREIGGQVMARIEPERPGESRPASGVRSYSVFPTRSDVEVRAPTKLFAQIAAPRASESGTKLTRRKD